jgi:hypothetical protein
MTICSLYGVLKFLILQVVIGQQFVVPSYSKVSLHPQPTKQDSDEEQEHPDDSSGMNYVFQRLKY